MLVAFGLVGSVSAIEINENLSINGFIDGSYISTDSNPAGVGTGTDTTEIGLDEIELNFLFTAGGASGEIHIDTDPTQATAAAAGGNDNDGSLNIEQAHLSYGFEGGLTLTAGRFGSLLGLEREDPGGLFTYSRAFSDDFSLGNVDVHQQEGLRLSYTSDQFSVAISASNAQDATEETAATEDDLDWEVSLAYTGIENLALGGGVQTNNEENVVDDNTILNIHAGYTMGKALIAAEWSNIDSDTTATADLDAYQILVDYDVSDVLGLVVRYAEEDEGAGTNADSVTIAPNYAINDNLGAILEYTNKNAGDGSDEDFLAVELTFTF